MKTEKHMLGKQMFKCAVPKETTGHRGDSDLDVPRGSPTKA